MNTEKILNIKLDPLTREKLDAQAKENGRAVCREAAAIIKDAVKERA